MWLTGTRSNVDLYVFAFVMPRAHRVHLSDSVIVLVMLKTAGESDRARIANRELTRFVAIRGHFFKQLGILVLGWLFWE
jgi:hypothetical protein